MLRDQARSGALGWRKDEAPGQRLIKCGLAFTSCLPSPQGEPRRVSRLGSPGERGREHQRAQEGRVV